ncbi:MAG: ABC transporter permease, partial [SAR202 cluster bacterium]|nr:ABC transporter permease [SAR202 cluster bacterium]
MVRRLFSMFISVIGATVIIFIMTRLGPDPIDLYLGDTQVDVTEEYLQLIRAELGLDKSLPEQYLLWVWNISHFDMGQSIGTRMPVSIIIRTHIWTTLKLAMGAWIFAVIVGVSVGVLSAVKRATF